MFKMYIEELEQEKQRKFFVFKIIALESGTIISHNSEQNTCHWHSVCDEIPLTFNISLREIFSKSGSFRVMKNLIKVLSC